jgi:hypothetical protein
MFSDAIAKARQEELRREAERQRLARRAHLARKRTRGGRTLPTLAVRQVAGSPLRNGPDASATTGS